MSTESDLDAVRTFMSEHDCRFICPDCGGAFWGTRLLGKPDETGYCKTDGCRFTWPRTNDGQVFHVVTPVDEVLRIKPLQVTNS